MKALSVHQPWASLIAVGAKKIETRTWEPPRAAVGQLLAIHATKPFTQDQRELCGIQPFRAALGAGRLTAANLPRGAVVAVCLLVRCRTTFDHWERLTEQEEAFGDFTRGRFGWELELVHRIEPPVLATGHQGIWDWNAPPALLKELGL